MESPTGIIPEELMFPSQLEAVLEFLERAPIRGQKKKELLLGWAKTVGVKLRGSQYFRVYRSGIDIPRMEE